ncbi:MAG: tetratricopeptide repeat protein [Muribaculaceae bacterium]|nr:tetratricopeptide repeat protein [Muribaculaceae bacterium]
MNLLKTSHIIICILLLAVMPIQAVAQINAEQVMRVGQNALYFEDYMLSIQYFNQTIQAKPYLAQPYFFRAIAKLNLEDYMGAEDDATMAIERNPFIADAYEVRGVARQNRGKFAGAVEDYDSALRLLPKNRGLLFNKALAQQALHLPDSALNSFNMLLAQFPRFENGYLGRARLMLETGDTVKAREDIDKALGLNKNLAPAYLLRADIAINADHDFPASLSDMNEAIRLQPREAGLYINRAFLRYNTDDYGGAMDDYDYALQLDPLNVPATYNRGLLRMEVRDFDNAVKDFTRVLELDPEDYRSLYNRAVIYSEKHDIKRAMADVDKLVDRFPDLPEALYMRSNLHRMAGEMGAAERDYNKALAMAKALKPSAPSLAGAAAAPVRGSASSSGGGAERQDSSSPSPDEDTLSPEAVARRFTALRTVDSPIEVEGEYNNKSIRGRVQDRAHRIELEPLFALTYYTSPTELKPSSYYLKEVDDVNTTRMLRFLLQITNDDVAPSEETGINRHFQSIEYYNSYIATHTPRAIDYFARAMDFVVLRDYAAAIKDLNKALELTPDFALGYFERAVARYKALKAGNNPDAAPVQAEIRAVVADFDKAIELSPRMSFAYFNKGNVYAELGDFTSALAAYNKAIELKPDLGEAYYNRGYVYFQLGDRERGTSNLSKAGELGIMPSYNLLKRMH